MHYTHPIPGMGDFFIQSMATLYIKLKGMKPTTKMKANIFVLTHTFDHWSEAKR